MGEEEKHPPWWSIKGSLSTKLVEPHTENCHQMTPIKLDSGITGLQILTPKDTEL